jgi:ferredoxin
MGLKHKVTVQDTDIVFDCDEDISVLQAMLHSGKGPIHFGCCGGGCGVCKARIVSGNSYVFKSMSAAHVNEAEKKDGIVLLCCVQARSDLIIAAG